MPISVTRYADNYGLLSEDEVQHSHSPAVSCQDLLSGTYVLGCGRRRVRYVLGETERWMPAVHSHDPFHSSAVTHFVIDTGWRTPDWVEPVINRLTSLAGLESNWDSHGSRPIQAELIAHGLDLLLEVAPDEAEPPSLVPGADGSLQIEWHTTQMDLEIDIERGGEATVYFRDKEQGIEWEKPLGDLRAELPILIPKRG